ncbi:MAG: hypothetical protein FWE16_06105 [Firmicutes bacterium]|nr:hypothetical protein [Bacillota bacterium]
MKLIRDFYHALTRTTQHKIAFWAFIAGMIFIILGLVTQLIVFSIIALFSFLIFIIVSAIQTHHKLSDFDNEMHQQKKELLKQKGIYTKHMTKKELDEEDPFTDRENEYIRKRRKRLKGVIWLKFAFIVVLAILLISMIS